MNKAFKVNKKSWRKTRYFKILKQRLLIGRMMAAVVSAAAAKNISDMLKSVNHNKDITKDMFRINKSLAIARQVINTQFAVFNAMYWWRIK